MSGRNDKPGTIGGDKCLNHGTKPIARKVR